MLVDGGLVKGDRDDDAPQHAVEHVLAGRLEFKVEVLAAVGPLLYGIVWLAVVLWMPLGEAQTNR